MNPFTAGGMAAAGLFGITVLFGSWYTVDQGERVVVTRNGAVVDEAGPGLHFKTPWVESISRFEVRTTKAKEPVFQAYSKDIQPADVSMSVNMHVDPGKVKEIYGQFGPGYQDRIVTPAGLQAAKEVIGKYAAADIVNQRDKIASDIREDLEKKLGPAGIVIETVQIEDIAFSKAFVNSVEARMQAEIAVKQQEQMLAKTEVEARQALAVAQGKANGVKAEADAEAYRITTVAKSQAEAIRSQGDALRSNPLFVELTKANKWDGKLPTTMLPNGATPLLDMRAPKE